MNFYHGSNIKGLKGLLPFESEHKKPYIYFAQNPVVALFYSVKAVEKPYNWFPYGFNDDGVPVYTEYYPNAFADVYKNKTGYLYLCKNLTGLKNPTNINGAYVSEEPVVISACEEILDIYEKFLQWEREGLFIIRHYESLTDQQKQNLEKLMIGEIKDLRLLEKPNCSYSKFIKEKMPAAFEKAEKLLKN